MSITPSCGAARFGPDALLYICNECDPALLLGGHVPTASADPRHGEVILTLDHPFPGRLVIGIDSGDGSFNSEVPGDLIVVHLPTDPGVPLGTNSNLTFAAGTGLFAPGGAPIATFFENGQLQFRSKPQIFRDNFEIGDAGWWSEAAP